MQSFELSCACTY